MQSKKINSSSTLNSKPKSYTDITTNQSATSTVRMPFKVSQEDKTRIQSSQARSGQLSSHESVDAKHALGRQWAATTCRRAASRRGLRAPRTAMLRRRSRRGPSRLTSSRAAKARRRLRSAPSSLGDWQQGRSESGHGVYGSFGDAWLKASGRLEGEDNARDFLLRTVLAGHVI